GVSGRSCGVPRLPQGLGQVGRVLRTRSRLSPEPKLRSPFDLHMLSAPPACVLSQDQTLRRDRSSGQKAGFAVFWSRSTEEAPSAGLLTRPASITERFLLCTVVKPRARRTGLGVTRSLASHAVQFSRCEQTRESPRKSCSSSRRGPRRRRD